ncbi:MAG: DUF3187 family protein [Spirochaetaceae bacterium]|nr:DUF3187 family protein [Spirochaetaceae bacterium]MDT8298182.1 DUF3187 family protein [Spirochaetaceae bacterium]
MKLRFLIVVVCLASAMPPMESRAISSGDRMPLGPLGGRNVYAPHQPWFSFPAEMAAPFPVGTMRARTGLYYVNEFSTYPFEVDNEIPIDGLLTPERQEQLTAMDFESLILETGWDWQAVPEWRFSADWRLHVRYAGFLDDVIVWWHDILSLPNAGREYFSHHRSQWTIRGAGGDVIEGSGTVVSSGDLDLRSVWSFYNSPKLDLALETAFKIPLSHYGEGFSSSYPDIGTAFLADWHPWMRWAFYVNAGMILPLGPQGRIMGQFIPVVEFRAARNLSLILQANIQSSPIEGEEGDSYSHPVFGDTGMFLLPQTDIKLGIRGRSGRLGWQFFIEEDPLTWEGPDILVYFGGEWTLNTNP